MAHSPTNNDLVDTLIEQKIYKYRLEWLQSFQKIVRDDKTLWDILWLSVLKSSIWKNLIRTTNIKLTLIDQKHSSESVLLIVKILEKKLKSLIDSDNPFYKYYNLQQAIRVYPEMVIKMSFNYNPKAMKEDNSLLYEALFQKHLIQNLLTNCITPHVIGFVSLFQMPLSTLRFKNHRELESQLVSREVLFFDDDDDIRYDKTPPGQDNSFQRTWKYKGIFQDIAWLDIHKEKKDKATGEYILVRKKHNNRLYHPYETVQGLVVEKSSGEQLEYWLREDRSLHCWRTVFFQILYTLRCFNDNGLRHNDLHNSNIFIEGGEDSYYSYIVKCKGDTAIVASLYNKPMVKIFDFNFSAIDKSIQNKYKISPESVPEVYRQFYNEIKEFSHLDIINNTSLDDRKFKKYYGTTHERNTNYDMFCCFYYIYHQLYLQPWHTCKVLKEFIETCIHPGLLHFCFDSVKGWKGRLGIPKKYANNLYKGYISKEYRPIKAFMKGWEGGEILPEHLLTEPSLDDKDLWFILPMDKILELPFFESFYKEVKIDKDLWTDNTFCLPRYTHFREFDSKDPDTNKVTLNP